jgi:maleate isomerase
MLTPSSNTVVEPMASTILRDVSDVSVHYSRLPVTEISLTKTSARQFELDAYLAAANLLADAKVHVIGWNGTSASWSGFEADERLCRAIAQAFNVESTTAVLAINELLVALKSRKLAFVTPYTAQVQSRIMEVYEKAGFECVAEHHSGKQVNYAFAEIGDDELTGAIRSVARAEPDAIVVMCTNLRAAHLVDRLEAELDIPILDSVAAFVWKAAQLCGIDTRGIKGWGRLFQVLPDAGGREDAENA